MTRMARTTATILSPTIRGSLTALWLAAAVARSDLSGAVRITELMSHPPGDKEGEYIELHNTGASAVSIAGWSFTSGVAYTFPAGAEIPPGGYVVACRSRAAIQSLYPALAGERIFGDTTGSLANEGEVVTLVDARGALQESVRYDDELPWDFLADGFGPSLERLCPDADGSLPENWRSSPLGRGGEPGGTPGAANTISLCPPEAPVRPRVFFSEILYHAVLEESLVERHELLEIHNSGAGTVSLGGWRLLGAVDYTFPPGSEISPGEYLVVAKDPAALAAEYGLDPDRLYGPYERELDNGGERLALLTAGGLGADVLVYDDDSPWPVAADALGAGESWLPPSLLPLAAHRYRGHSLERVSFNSPGTELANWVPSPLDAPTPGGPSASGRSVPLPVVAQWLVQTAAGDPVIRDGQPALVQVRFTPAPPVGAVTLESFVDLFAQEGEPVLSVAMTDDGAGGDLVPGDGVFTATLSGRPENSIVRYRFLADRGRGSEVLSPRPDDPFAWHAYFVSPEITAATRVYQIFIDPADWTRLWDNIQGGRVSGCDARATWNARVPAVFIHDGRVFDVQVRYQGSRWNRTNGPAVRTWPYPGPSRPSPLRALSWRISFPRYSQFEGQGVIILNKLTQACPGFTSGVGYRLYAEAGLPAPLARYVRLHINGGYYHYMMEYERPGEDMMRRYHREQAAREPGLAAERVGHLFKSAGCTCDEGPYGWGDERLLSAYCGHSAAARYAATYDRKTHEWDSHDEFIALIEELHRARAAGTAAVRQYFEEHFDMDLLLSYLAIMNWSVPFDDMFQNHFLYQRLSDGKWLIVPWDLDLNYGGWKGAGASLYMGEQGDPDNRSGWWNYLKDAFLKAFRAEYEDRLVFLNNTLLHRDHVNELLDQVMAEANPAEMASAPAGLACSFSGKASELRSFAARRFDVVNQALSAVRVDAGPNLTAFAGSPVQFDARASRPDPGPGVEYAWSNGMAGDYPTFVFTEPGVFEITLTVTVNGTPFSDSVTVTVLERPPEAFVEEDGQVVMEAESFWTNDRHGADTTWWEEGSAVAGFSGRGYMEARDTEYTKFPSNYAGSSPELRYAILFAGSGAYRVWIRGVSGSTQFDSCHVSLNGVERDESFATRFTVDPGTFLWAGDTRSQGPQEVAVPEPGLHFLSVWVRESGQVIDKIILTRSTSFSPSGVGPAESDRVPTEVEGSFTRGDANGDGAVELADAVAVLAFLFRGGSALRCEDHGDADDNGRLEIADAVALLEYLFRGGRPPAPPYPGRGVDPTADAYACGGGG